MSVPTTQKALQINSVGGPEVLEVNSSAPVPTITADQILVKNTHAGVNYIDTVFRAGIFPPPSFPYTLGREGEGHVVAVGDKVSPDDFKVGDHVGYMMEAAQAEFTAVDTATAVRAPAGIEPGLTAAALLQGLTALTMVRESYPVKKGDAVLVHAAAGGVGLWLVRLLRVAGAGKIIATASTDDKLALAVEHGATHTVNYSRGSADWVARVNEITADEGGVAAVFDGVGRDTFDGDLEVVARKGTVVLFGTSSGPVPPLVLDRLVVKNIKVVRPQLFGYVTTKQELADYAGELLDLVRLKKVAVHLHKTYPLADARQVHQDVEGRATSGKLLFSL